MDALAAVLFFFFNDTATTEIYTLSLHDALPISSAPERSTSWWRARTRSDDRCWRPSAPTGTATRCGSSPLERSEEHTSELQSRLHLVCRLLLEKKKNKNSLNPALAIVPEHAQYR